VAHRRHDYRRAKKRRLYTVEELARLYSVHKNTVRNWAKAGLLPIDDSRPLLFKRADVAAFHKERRDAAKRPCGPGQFYCLPCRAIRSAAGEMADYVPQTNQTGNLRGICPVCERLMHRRVNYARLAVVARGLEVTLQEGEVSLRERSNPTVTCDFEMDGSIP